MSDRESDVQNYRVVHLGRPNPTILRPSQPRPAIMHSLKKSSALQKAPIPIQLRSRPQSLPAMSRTSEETESQARSLFSTSMTPRTRPFSDFPVTYFRDYSASQSFTRSPDENEVPSTPPIPPRNSLRLSKGLRSPNCSKMPNRRHARELSPASVDSAGTEESGGLGINFYDHLGNATRITFRELDLEDLEDLEAKSARGFPGSVFDGQPPTNVSGHASNDLEVPPGPLIEKLLEENYRAQAETFVRNSSRASVRSLALSNHSPSVGSNHSNSSPVTGPATSDTPTRQVSKGESFASNQRSQSLRTPSNKVVVEPFRVKSVSRSGSGFSPEVPSGQRHTTPSTYGHRIYSTPTSSSPEIVKRRYRSSTEPRGPLYFTSQERQAIAELVHAKPRSCDRHTDCTDCTNIEYAYYENKTMPTSMAPEERQKIINNNRSLRNIKNVSIRRYEISTLTLLTK
jgi:hypothetical protein